MKLWCRHQNISGNKLKVESDALNVVEVLKVESDALNVVEVLKAKRGLRVWLSL
jgi:hypothetical protein